KFLGVISLGDEVTMADFYKSIPNSEQAGDFLLQMAIGRAEHSVILGMDQALLARFRIVVLELHWLDCVFDRLGYDVIKATLDKLL
ncbi:hypothetical protein, partial [Staphylococcus aureus]